LVLCHYFGRNNAAIYFWAPVRVSLDGMIFIWMHNDVLAPPGMASMINSHCDEMMQNMRSFYLKKEEREMEESIRTVGTLLFLYRVEYK